MFLQHYCSDLIASSNAREEGGWGAHIPTPPSEACTLGLPGMLWGHLYVYIGVGSLNMCSNY